MNARQAREMAVSTSDEVFQEKQKEIKNLITSEASKGKFFCDFYGSVPDALKISLELEGFKLKYIEEPRDAYLRIKW